MSVLVVEPAAFGGLHAHVADELAALQAAGMTVTRADVDIRERPDLRADAASIRALRRSTADGVTAVHAHGLRAGGLAALALWRRRTVRLVVTLHNRPVGSRSVRAVGSVLLRILARRADTVLAVSLDLLRDAVNAGARDVRLAVIPAHAPTPQADQRPEAAREDGPLLALVIARLAPQKGLADLLDAVALLERENPGRVRVDVVGEGPLRAPLAARIAAARLPVRLLGRRDDVPALLGAADLVISAARWEGQPVALQEALHAGAPIVATDAGGTREVTGDAALLVPVGDARALADAVGTLTDPAERAERARKSRRRAAELPGFEDMTTQLRAVLAPDGAR